MPDVRVTPIEIRVLEERDREAVLRIDATVSGKDRRDILDRRITRALSPGRISTSLVAVSDGQVAGFVLGDVLLGEYGGASGAGTIDTVGVLPPFQKRGVARRLLRAYVNQVRALGVERMTTLVHTDDVKLLGFFDRAGFRPAQAVPLELDLSSVQPGQWGDGEADDSIASRTP